jgi:hypothetical protein
MEKNEFRCNSNEADERGEDVKKRRGSASPLG